MTTQKQTTKLERIRKKYAAVYEAHPEIRRLEDKTLIAFADSSEGLKIAGKTKKQMVEIAEGFLYAFTAYGKGSSNAFNRFWDLHAGSNEFRNAMVAHVAS